jgi:RHS repeat-associated protein
VFKEGNQLNQLGSPTGTKLPPGYRTLALGETIDAPTATVSFGFGAVPKRVFGLLSVDISTNDTPNIRHVALVSLAPDSDGKAKLAVIDITLPTAPALTNHIELPGQLGLGLPQSVIRRPNRQVALATSRDLVILDQRHLFTPAPQSGLHPAILAIVPGAGSGNISLGGNSAGVNAVALGGRNQLVQEPPRLQFVRVLRPGLTDPSTLAGNTATLEGVFAAMQVEQLLGPARYRTNNGAANPTMVPPNPTNHYHVLMRTPGGAGAQVKLGLQSLNRSGYPLKNKGRGFAPVRAVSSLASQQLKQEARQDCDAPIRELTAYRLSSDVKDPFYNVYLSKPFALTYEKLSIPELATLTSSPDREIVWSDFYLEAFIDPEETSNPVLGPFAATVGSSSGGSDLILIPRACVVAETFPATYIPGPNPPPTSQAAKMPGTFGTLSANNGEFRHETIDVALPGKRMPIVFERVQGGQDLYEGPFGRGWDFTYNQRLTPLRPEIVGRDHRLPVILRSLNANSTIAEPGDLLWHTGRGRLVVYKNKGEQAPTEVASDPLLTELQWQGRIRAYYLPAPAEAGIFDPIFEFQDGQFARLTPDGRQYWHNRSGRLEKIYHRYVNNYHKLVYNHRGELTKIIDAAIDNDQRFLEIGYYRLSGDAEFVTGLDVTTSKVFQAGKIARLRDYALRVIDFFYTDDGILEKRLGFEGSSANNGDGGRVETVYLYTDPCSGFLQGVTTGGSSASSPLFAASVDALTGVVSGSGNGAGGAVSITPPSQNDAAAVGGSTASATGPDGGMADYTFDSFGFPARTTFSGPGAGTASTVTTYGAYGLLEKVVYPLGSTVEYTYDTNNVLLRSRGNLLIEKRTPGSRPGAPITRTFSSYDQRYNLPPGGATDFNGKSVTYSLTGDGRDIDKISYQNASARDFDYTAFGQLDREETPEGVVIDPEFNTDGFKVSEKRGAASITYAYDGSTASKLGLPSTISLPVGAAITDLQYDERLQLLQLRRGGFSEKRGYDRNGNVKYIERELGGGRKYIERRTYNQVNFLEKIDVENVEVDGSGTLLTTEFKSTPADNWRIRKIIHPGGQNQEFTYDHLGNVISMKLGSTEELYTRDLHGNLLSLKIGGQEVRKVDYDGHDRPIKITEFLGDGGSNVTDIDYFGAGEIKDFTVTSAGFGVVREVHVTDVDGLGRATHRQHVGPSGNADYGYTYTTGSGGQVVINGPRDSVTTKYDNAGRMTSVSSAVADVTFSPDANGNVLTIASTEGARTYTASYAYDSLDHLLSHSDTVGQVQRFTPNADGTFGEVFDGRNKKTGQTFTVLGELASATRPSGVQFIFRYNKNRQPTLAGDSTSAGHKASYDTATFRLTGREVRSGAGYTYGGFNAQNLPTSGSSPVGAMTFGFDLQGRLTSQTAEHSQGDSYQVSFKRDALNRVREAKYGKSANYTATFDYDALGPLLEATYTEALGSFTVGATYYADGSRKTLSYPSGNVALTEDRDPAGRLNAVIGSGDLYRVQTYLGIGQPGQVELGGGLIQEMNDYDGRRRILSRRYERNGVMLADVRYRYDLSDNREVRQEIHRHGRADLFEYDDDNRLTRADFGARPAIPDAVRNGASALRQDFGFEAGLFARTYVYGGGAFDLLTQTLAENPDALLLLLPPPFVSSLGGHDSMLFATQLDGATRPAPDAMGNTTGTTLFVRPAGAADPIPVTASLRYNGIGQLVGVSYTDQGVAVAIEYEHQPNGLMHYRKVTRGATVVSERALIYDRGRLLEEFENVGGGGQPQARYYYADDDSPFAAELPDASGNLQFFYYLRDAQGSVMAVADSSGHVVERVNYDAWGQPVIQPRDTAPPRVSAIIAAANNELLVQFTETVLPPLAGAGPGSGLVTGTVGLGSAFELISSGVPVALGQTTYEENLPGGFPFGAVIRLRPLGVVPPSLVLRVSAGALIDEWGLPNPPEEISFSLGGAGSVLFQGPAAGSTAPTRVARSTLGSPFLFHGQYFDYDAGLLYLRLRFYDPYTGSFLQQDPRGYRDSVNLYAGFRHNPTSLRDPTGAAPPKGGKGSSVRSGRPAGRPSRAVELDDKGKPLPRPLPDPPNRTEGNPQSDPPPPVIHRSSSKSDQTPDDVSGSFDEPTQPGRPAAKKASQATDEDDFNEPTVEIDRSQLDRDMQGRFEKDAAGNQSGIERNPTTEASVRSLGLKDEDIAKLFNGEVVRFELPNPAGSPTIGFARIQGGRLQVEGFSLQSDAGGTVFNLINQARTVARDIGARELELIAGQVEESSGRLARILQSRRFGFTPIKTPLSVDAGELDSGNPSFSKIEVIK